MRARCSEGAKSSFVAQIHPLSVYSLLSAPFFPLFSSQNLSRTSVSFLPRGVSQYEKYKENPYSGQRGTTQVFPSNVGIVAVAIVVVVATETII